MAALPAWRSSSVLLASLPLVLLLAVTSHGGKSKTFLRNNYSPQDQPQIRSSLPQAAFNRFGRNFRVDDEPSPFTNFGGFPPAPSTGSFRSGQSLKSRKGGSRTFGSSRSFPGFGGPDSFLEAATTERSETDDDEVQAFQFSGSAGLESTRPGSTGSRKGGASRGATKVGGAKSPSGSSSFGFLEGSPSLVGRDPPPFPTFSGSAGLDFPGLTGQDFNGPEDLIFGRTPNLGLNAPGAATFSGSAVPDFSFGANNAFFSGAEGPPQVRPGAGSTANTFNNFMSSFGGSGTNPFGSSPLQFPSSRGQFPGPASSIFPQPGEDTSVQFPPNPSFAIPDPSANFPYPIDEHIAKLLLREIETTTTKPPNRVTSAEDRKKVFSGGLEYKDDAEFSRLTLPKGGVKKPPETKRGCNSKPSAPANGRTDCATYAGCRAVCNPRYHFPTGDRRLFLTCDDGEWKVTGGSFDTLPNCEPICIPPCENSGICLAPDVCQCPDNWEGNSCEIPKAPPPKECSTKPPTPMNSRIFCSKDECIARCHEGYHFTEGTSRLTFQCNNGAWVVSHPTWTDTTPDCQPICDPACTNEGRCIAPDVCECTPDYRGDICQYPTSNCEPKKLGFNGGYNCSGEGMDFGCVLWCPEDVEFEFPAAERYTCDYTSSVWSPAPIPLCDYGFLAVTPSPFEPSRGTYPPFFDDLGFLTTTQTAKKLPGSCFTWSGTHFKSFDGKVYSFESSCPYTLLQDSTHGTFTVNLRTADGCEGSSCPKVIQIFLEDDEYVLQATESGQPSLAYQDTNLAIPGQMNGVVSERVAHFVVVKVSGLGLTIKWDMKNLVVTDISEVQWNKTSGLCGRLDGHSDNDWSNADGTQETNIHSFLYSWKARNLGEMCMKEPSTKHPCEGSSEASLADKFCSRLLNDPRFYICRQVVDVEPYINACRWDYCGCESEDRETCACETFAAFNRECASTGVTTDSWRSHNLCPMRCEAGLVYNPCMQASQTRCGRAVEDEWPEFCVEGCDCPSTLLLHDGRCINPSNCPCTYHNKEYHVGDTLPNDCNSCTCLGGEWVCTEVKCGSRCAVVGDPHYTTFDGRHFDFMGKCSYYLVQGQDFSIEAENTPCAGAISENMHIQNAEAVHFPSCTKTVTIRIEGTVIHLKQRREITVNGNELRRLPAWIKGAYIKAPSNLFIMVELRNGLEVWWDGHTRVYVDAPAGFRDKTTGMCGTFNDNQSDDFLTPEGDVETSPVLFGNKWRTSETCPEGPEGGDRHPCEKHVQVQAQAEKYCQNLKSRVFDECHLAVDPEPYYRDCLYDVCSCDAMMDQCLCPILASFGKECARKGVLVDWRAEIRECAIQCTGGQVYQVCGNSCSHTCLDLAINTDCKTKCVEGCNCPVGFSLDNDDICVPVTECPCVYDGQEYKSGYKMQQPQTHGASLTCECYSGGWTCEGSSGNQTVTSRPQVVCRDDHYEVYSDCLPQDQVTCQTMHLRVVASEECRPGCACAPGYVREPNTGTCVITTQCPCHHGGRSYQDAASISQDCNTCVCSGGQWVCTDVQCPGVCTAWGDSHYKTFDGRIYEFQGVCDYILAKGNRNDKGHFDVTVQNVACGTDGVTCAKSITLRLVVGEAQELVQFSRNKPVPVRNLTRTIIREAGVFVFAEVPDLDLVLQWDRGTRAYLRLSPDWRGQVHGLCGNYNGDEKDDFQTPGGSREAKVNIFGDAWRLHSYCPASLNIKNTCKIHPHRKAWAAEQCAVLTSEVFTPCHSEVPVEPYEERCVFDGCGCDTGGDCHCLCTAVAAYAHECNMHGVYVRWRRPDFCPMQCDESCEHYEACIPTCPLLSCDTIFDPSPPMCALDACVEGCSKNECPPGQVYESKTQDTCVPKADCQKECMEVNGTLYMEGEVISKDECHTCYCSQKSTSCRGVPCRLTSDRECGSGWSNWISRNSPATLNRNADMESVPQEISMVGPPAGWCKREKIVEISCRSVETHRPHTEQPWARCSLQEGLLCVAPHNATPPHRCWDYEVQFLCDCAPSTSTEPTREPFIASTTPTPSASTTPTPCAEEGWSQWYNSHSVDKHGDLEPLADIRELYEVCPEDYTADVECRPVGGGELQPFATCDKTGVTCINNVAKQQYCEDYELRVLCRCGCQDGLGMEDYSIRDAQVTASSVRGPGDEPGAARLNSDGAWTPSVDDHSSDALKHSQWLQVDLGTVKEVRGVVTQGHPDHDWYVETFALKVSQTGTTWDDIMDQDSSLPKEFRGNSDSSTAVTNILPAPAYARYVRIIPNTFHTRISLRLELKGCDVQEPTTSYPEMTSSTPECTSVIRCDRLCLHHRSQLENTGKCAHDEETTRACTTCRSGQYLRDEHTCVAIQDCNCYLPNGASAPPGQPVRISDCETCQCVNNDLRCNDVCLTSTTLATTSATEEPELCTEWSPWMSESTPSSGEDSELLTVLLTKYSALCSKPLDIQCRVKGSHETPDALGQVVVCERDRGLQCLAALNPQGCADYEVRFLCECPLTVPSTEVAATTTVLPPVITTPPPPCHHDGYVNLLGDVEDGAFSSTPARSSDSGASSARLYHSNGTLTSGGSWSPLRNDRNQFVEVDLGSLVPVYGVVVAGNPRTKERVRSFTVQVSRDSNIWSDLPADPSSPTGPPKVLRGPLSASELRTEVFDAPVEARYIKLLPVDWDKGIALRFEVIGCSLATLPPTTVTTPAECEEPMGVESGEMSDQQIVVSSVLKNDDFYGKQNIRLNSVFIPTVAAGAWVAEPRPQQYVTFDLQEARKLSGVITQGRDRNKEWVESFTVRYSPDGLTWNTLQNPDGSDKVFDGNYDDSSPSITKFERVIEARYLEVRPKTWKNNIALRVEVLGCFQPYITSPTPASTPTPTPTAPPPPTCTPCQGLPHLYYDTCVECDNGESFDGQACVPDLSCPCFRDGLRYNAGVLFNTADCEECECIHSEAVCVKKQCQPCQGGEQGILTLQCGCECKPCPPGSKLCPSSNYCLNETSWCDGVEHCPDDEVDCVSTTPEGFVCPTLPCPDGWKKEELLGGGDCPIISCQPPQECSISDCPPEKVVNLISKKPGTPCMEYSCEPRCSDPECPPGYTVSEESESDEEFRSDAGLPEVECSEYWCDSHQPPPCPSQRCSPGYTLNNYTLPSQTCPKFKCEVACPPLRCPRGYITFSWRVSKFAPCPAFGCIPIRNTTCPQEEKPLCRMDEDVYQINPGAACPQFACRPVSLITPKPEDKPWELEYVCKVEWKMLTTFDGSTYQLEMCNHVLAQDKVHNHWTVAVHRGCVERRSPRCEGFLLITLHDQHLILHRDLTISWKNYNYTVAQAKGIGSWNGFTLTQFGSAIVVFKSKIFDFEVKWDIDMNVAISLGINQAYKVYGLCGYFTESAQDDMTKPDGTLAVTTQEFTKSWAAGDDDCQHITCTKDVTKEALTLCTEIRTEPFAGCHETLNPDTVMKLCVESTCECLSAATDEDECRCHALSHYVSQCLERNPDAPVLSWRMLAKCGKECGPGETYQHCFPNKCEKQCENLHEEKLCNDRVKGCSSGCYCAHGYVRKGGKCVTPDACKDCVCEGYGDPHYTTFDNHNYNFNGECSYVAVQDKNDFDLHEFQVVLHNERCSTRPVTLCTKALSIHYKTHLVFISSHEGPALSVALDDLTLTTFPHQDHWLKVDQPDHTQVMVTIVDLQLEVDFFLENHEFKIRIPSYLYFNKTEGLCGNCNHNNQDDLVAKNIGLVDSVESFGRSWLLEGEASTCSVLEKEPCLPLPPHQDPCLYIMDEHLFGRCHPLENPVTYISSCQLDTCHGSEPNATACESLVAYATRCAELGICLQWRSDHLCPKNCLGGQEYRSCVSGCVRTCENYERLDSNPDECSLGTVDGCFCPEGMVVEGGSCVKESYCKMCDDAGHRVGDVWQPDPCKTCQCSQHGVVECQAKSCPTYPACQDPYTLVTVPDSEDSCCGPNKTCESIRKPPCPVYTKPLSDDCGHNKQLKLVKGQDDCLVYACVCVPPEDCPKLIPPEDKPLRQGEEWTLDESGCCPEYTPRCTGECIKVMCPKFYTLREEPAREGECCPQTSCEHPEECIYEYQFRVDEDGFQQTTGFGNYNKTELQPVGESWEDGLCRSCECVEDSDGHPRHQCTQRSCPALDTVPDHRHYKLNTLLQPYQCCPVINKIACIDGNHVIEVGHNISEGCRSVACVEAPGGDLQKREIIHTCEESCSAGWEYQPPPPGTDQCCGKCLQVGCVVEGEVKTVNETWTSDDHCTLYTCLIDAHDQVQVEGVTTPCGEPSDEQFDRYVFERTVEAGACCPVYTKVACLLNGTLIQVGTKFTDPDDVCVMMSCVVDVDGNITRHEQEMTCNTQCDLGSVYREPTTPSDCCGQCVKVSCVDKEREYTVGEQWRSTEEPCHQFSCELHNHVPTLVAATTACPYFNPQCPPDNTYMDDLGCCKLCSLEPKGECKPEEMPPQDTLGIFQISDPASGICTNSHPVAKFMQCSGQCDSHTNFTLQGLEPQHVSTCFCCKPSRFDTISVDLHCESGQTFSNEYVNIAECQCQLCDESSVGHKGV